MDSNRGFMRFGLGPFPKKGSILGISCFRDEQLEVVFLERSGDQYQLLGREQVAVGQSASPQAISTFQNNLSKYRLRSPVWIHIVLRHAAFVKLFYLPGATTDQLDSAVTKRIQEEMPYLVEELSYHYTTQGIREDESKHVAMFGISKAVLKDHLDQLDRLGMTPDRVLLSTEILFWYYQTYIFPEWRELQSIILIHLFPRQAELIYLENGRILQSRWVSQEESDFGTLGEAIDSATRAFHRESKWKPKAALVFTEKNDDLNASFPNFSVPVHPISPWPQLTIPPLMAACAEATRSGNILNFTLPEIEEKQRKEANASGWGKLFFSIFCVAFSIFLFTGIHTLSGLGETAWIQMRAHALGKSVQEVKLMRTQAFKIKEFRERKASPVLLLAGLRQAMPVGILLRELDYRGEGGGFFARGAALQQALVEQFTQTLSRESGFYHVTLERVQAQQDERGGTSYSFEIKGFLQEDSKV